MAHYLKIEKSVYTKAESDTTFLALDNSNQASWTPTTVLVPNLNADLLDGINSIEFLQRDGSVALTANWDAGSFRITAETFTSDIATGTAPLIIASTTAVTNLNADLLDGVHVGTSGSAIPNMSVINSWTANQKITNADWVFQADLAIDFVHIRALGSSLQFTDEVGESTVLFDMPIKVTTTGPINQIDKFSQFGRSESFVTPSDATDRLVVIKQTIVSGVVRSGLITGEIEGASTNANVKMASLNLFIHVLDTTDINLTSTSTFGSYTGSRVVARIDGTSITISQGSLTTFKLLFQSGATTTVTRHDDIFFEKANVRSGNTLTTYNRIRIQDNIVGGTLTTHTGLRIEDLITATTSLAIFLEGTNNKIHFNQSTESLHSPSTGVLQLDANTRITMNQITNFTDGVALGLGNVATLGRIGSGGPTAAAQSQWLQVEIGAVNHWIPVWV